MYSQIEFMYNSTVDLVGVDSEYIRPVVVNRLSVQSRDGSHAKSPISVGLFKAGPEYRTVRANGRSDWLLFLTIEGAGVFRTNDAAVTVGPQHATLYQERVMQDYGTAANSAPWTFAFAHVQPRPEWRSTFSWPQLWPGFALLQIDDRSTWNAAWSAMVKTQQILGSPLHRRIPLAVNALEEALLWCDEANPTRGPLPDPRIRRAAEYARQSISRPLSVAEMASEAGMSTSRLNVLFRDQIGESPHSYAERLRLEHAALLIESAGLNVQEVASACGYSDPFHFSRRFARRMGCPPSKWRSYTHDASTGSSGRR